MIKYPIVSDTSAFISLASVTDSNHKRAREISASIKKDSLTLIVPGEIVTELTNILGKKASHRKATTTAEKLIQSQEIVIVETTPPLRLSALEKFKTQPGSVSFTDCLVMAFADEFKTKYIFGFDRTFKKNGYIRFGIDKDNIREFSDEEIEERKKEDKL